MRVRPESWRRSSVPPLCPIHVIGGLSSPSSRHILWNDSWIPRNILLQKGQDSFSSYISYTSRTAAFNNCDCLPVVIKRLAAAVLWQQENSAQNPNPSQRLRSLIFTLRAAFSIADCSTAVRKQSKPDLSKICPPPNVQPGTYSGSQSRVRRCGNQEEKVRVPFSRLRTFVHKEPTIDLRIVPSQALIDGKGRGHRLKATLELTVIPLCWPDRKGLTAGMGQ